MLLSHAKKLLPGKYFVVCSVCSFRFLCASFLTDNAPSVVSMNSTSVRVSWNNMESSASTYRVRYTDVVLNTVLYTDVLHFPTVSIQGMCVREYNYEVDINNKMTITANISGNKNWEGEGGGLLQRSGNL